jgi:hypothetical protein
MEFSLLKILTQLVGAEIEFVVVGSLAAVLQGAPIPDIEIAILFAQNHQNIERLVNLLDPLDAIFRIQPHRKLRPNITHLAGNGHINLITKYGPLDLLTNIGNNLRYADILPLTKPLLITETTTINVLNLETLIALKEQLGGEKDLATLPILRQTLKQSLS